MRLVKSTVALAVTLALASCTQPVGESSSASKAVAPQTSAVQDPAIGSPKRVRLLTSEQYLNTLANIFGDGVRMNVNFAPLPRTDGLRALGAAETGITPTQVEQYQRAATAVAALAVDRRRREFLFECQPADPTAADRACAAKFLGTVGRLLYRQPMSEALLTEAVDKASETADRLKDFYAGISIALEGMLISPMVVLVADRSEPDPKQPGRERLDAYSVASRLSLFLWNAAPDDALLKAAESGEILTEKGMIRAVDRMLASSRLEDGVRAFFNDMFEFDLFAALAKDGTIYPDFTAITATDAREQTLRTVVDHLVVKKRDYRDLYTTRETFISPALGGFYGVPAPRWMPYQVPADDPRVGLLTHVSFLSLHSHPGRSSPTLRGKAVRELLLCQTVPSPPANVDFSSLNNPDPRIKTQRERVAQHLENPVCAGCHRITDPLGLALENFDGSGQYRETEMGAKIDASGTIDGVAFDGAAGLSASLRNMPALTSCVTRRAYSYATGGATSAADRASLTYIGQRFAEAGYKFPELMRLIALSAAFTTVREAPTAPAASASLTTQ